MAGCHNISPVSNSATTTEREIIMTGTATTIDGQAYAIGEHIAEFVTAIDRLMSENVTGYPLRLNSGRIIDDDRDADELRAQLRVDGCGMETDDTGLVLTRLAE